MIRTLLIANRGEIARRIIRTARRMGIRSVAVHSDVDAGAAYVEEADLAVGLGGASAAESYLDAAAILAAARRAGADAVHPGYGFLSENADFAAACADAGLIFVGPPPQAIRSMGDKGHAKALMREAGVPVVPGYDGDDQQALAEIAMQMGFPLLIKAAAGGGGRGMRRVFSQAELADALDGARREARSAFGDDRLILERLVTGARHIEVQVFADRHGHVIHLGERDCSTQRRHQKIIEETPSPFVDADLRAALGAAAVDAARAVGYEGAGTVEFIVGADRSFHFLEMNTRLQVEHPVTEIVTGLDLVEWQLRVAAGEPLPLSQDQVRFRGHAVEVRLYAEDPADGFRPQSGPVLRWRPVAGDGVRIDDTVREGDTVSPYYDPMIAKIIAHGRDRAEAIARLRAALLANPLFGIATNRRFLIDLLQSDAFASGAVTTDLVDAWQADGSGPFTPFVPDRTTFAIAAAMVATASGGDWFRSTGVAECPISLVCGGERRETSARFERGRLTQVTVDGEAMAIEGIAPQADQARLAIGGVEHRIATLRTERDLWLDIDGRSLRFHEPDPLAVRAEEADPTRIVSPVAGQIRAIPFAAGDEVMAGDTIMVIEAMKMETVLVARISGSLAAVHFSLGDQVRAGQLVAEIGMGD